VATAKTLDGPKTFEGEGLANFFKKKAALEKAARTGGAGNPAAPGGAANGAVLSVELERLDDNPFQPRGAMDEGPLEELVASIARHGLLQAITVRRVVERFQVIAGHRRVAAFRLLKERASDPDKAKYAAVPAQEKLEVTDEQMALYALVENLQRDDLEPVEAAAGLARYQEAESLSVQELAERTGLELRRVQRLLQLNAAPSVVKEGVSRGILVPVLDDGGKPLVTASGKERQERRTLDLMGAIEMERLYKHWARDDEKKAVARTDALVRRVLADGWTLRRIQAHCQGLVRGQAEAPSSAPATSPQPAFEESGRRLIIHRDRLGGISEIDRRALLTALNALAEQLR
jgi:ParB/RepB/Spo0J family partition protein